ncbi:MAG: DUF2442 domain-containing protein [Pedobacter sp.]|nr:DUF2442 domain-containing protein [Pedobacter sp.]MDQ8052971.1 DUF2442 domain-containing protein [Pedobacter sp.]
MEKQIKVWFENDNIFIINPTGEQKSHPLSWFPKLMNASDEERKNFTISPYGIHWEKIDEDLSFEGFNTYQK